MEVEEYQNNRFREIRETKKRREVVIDLARGFAVAMMVITHVIALLYNQSDGRDETIYLIGQFGGIASFTTFLFLTGVSSYFSILKYGKDEKESTNRARRSLIGRIIKLTIIYYILATASIFVTTTLYSLPPTIQWGENLIRTILLFIVPPFTEFLITIILIWITILIARRLYRYLTERAIIGIFLSAILYLFGAFLFQIDFGSSELNSIKGILFGHSDMHYFPVFQYLPIFIFGTIFGRFLLEKPDRTIRLRSLFLLTSGFGLVSFGFFRLFEYLNNPIFNPLQDGGRFPPSLGFISFSLFISFSIITTILLLQKILPGFIKVLLHFLGVNALEIFFFHILILFGIKYLTTTSATPSGAQFLYSSDVLILFIFVIGLSILFTNLKETLKNWATSEYENEVTWWFFTEKAVSTLIFVAIFSIVGGTVYREVFVRPAQANTTEFQFKKRAIQEEEWPRWWNYEYKSSRQITISNDSALPYFPGSWFGFNFNHRDAIGRGAAIRNDGNDVRIVYFDFDLGEFKEIPFIFEGIGSENAKIYFKIPETIGSNESSDRYFLYYGNEFTDPYPSAQDRFASAPNESSLIIDQETSQNIRGNVNKRWFLKKKATAYQAASLLFEANIDPNLVGTNSVVTYTVAGTNKSGPMRKVGDTLYQAAVVVSDLEPGVYRIQANVVDSSDGINIKRSFKSPFYVTYPLYVTWTMDWEGWDVAQNDLNDIANIADSNGMPVTHFFNPRIYVRNQYTRESISEERADYITDWVKDRQKNRFEEIGMHIHMWNDMVVEAGVTPRNTIIQGTYGNDVASYAYTQAELEQVFRWGRQKFAEYGLGAPVSYRTGAWMSGVNVLLAAQNAGFLIDSSGRTGGPVNPTISYSTPVPWNLSETTRPYLPNINDINSWSGNLENRMKIFEFPNNGADSYWFPLSDLIRRFDVNYPNKGDILFSPQVVTYLSHPHWFVSVDSYKIRSLFDYTNQFLYSNDNGPVIYETLENIYSEWDRDKFINGN